MDITYTYNILNVDEANRCMEVVYTSSGLPDMHIGVRIPFTDEALEDVIKIFAPIRYWQDYNKQLQTVNAGSNGTITYSPPPQVTVTTTGAATSQPISTGTQTL